MHEHLLSSAPRRLSRVSVPLRRCRNGSVLVSLRERVAEPLLESGPSDSNNNLIDRFQK